MGLLFATATVLHAEKPVVVPEVVPEGIQTFTIKTRMEANKEVPFYLRVPQNYRPGKAHRLLFLCPGLNLGGIKKIGMYPEWMKVADDRGWFVLSCTFHMPAEGNKDRKFSFYYPEEFSGKVVLEALKRVSEKYSVDVDRILMEGQSGGAQFVHRFAVWAPDRVIAVAVNSSSWFDPPNAQSNRVAWLMTIGESDNSFSNSLEMVDRLRQVGAAPLFRSYIGMLHEGCWEANELTIEFFKFHDSRTQHELGKPRDGFTIANQPLALQGEKMPYVGDSQDWEYVPNTPEERENIAEDYRVYIPSEEVAKLWGKPKSDEE
ncbi:MAG: hypothetical protein EAZ42_04120 [Verrucomicrobia bacterium]|nr:MAG: hypothetical protein EAZ42_04120 [Verrucomicrobiota bacterium]